jgi:phosphatidylglycerophosphatase A
MAMESTIFPLPSEAIIPPAMIVAQRTGTMTATGIVVAGAAIIVLVIGILSCSEHVRETGNPDPSECVIDELAGQWIACAFVAFPPFQLAPFFLSFALFRLFDIWKPWPVYLAETKLHSGLAVMMDDVVAGVMAGALAFVVHYLGWL